MPAPVQSIKPAIFVIFGATGDLARKKLFPALLDLYANDALGKQFRVIAFSRRDWNTEDFQTVAREYIVAKKHNHSEKLVNEFLSHIVYTQGEFDDKTAYKQLATVIDEQADLLGTCVDKLFYLATPPRFYGVIAGHVAASGIAKSCSDETGWSRILLEKPFGRDAESAEELEMQLLKLFMPQQIFLIDHYLAKETIQNILLFRFSNALFEQAWNSDSIERVELKLHEDFGLEGRVTYYDGIGALRDVGQSHLLQMLALIAMEHPSELSAESVREEREQVLADLRVDTRIPSVKAQYKGYADEEGINPASTTETFFRVGARIRNKRWKHTQFILESGKKLHERRATITIFFREAHDPLCEGSSACHLHNVLQFTIQPEEGISFQFWSRKPGFSSAMERRTMSFQYIKTPEQKIPDAYEYVLFRAMQGDQMLFRTPREESHSWSFIQKVLEMWDTVPLTIYEPGTHPDTIGIN